MRKVKNSPKLLKIRIIGDNILSQTALPVTEFDEDLQDFIKDLTYTMYETDGVGLAAPQVGVSKRIFVADFDWSGESSVKKPKVFINAEITFSDGLINHEEGCLSVPDVYEKVKRPNVVKVKAQNVAGEYFEAEYIDYHAVVFQHEFDHLNGVLFVDHLPMLKYLMHKNKIDILKSRTQPNGENIQA